ncbi:CaiB/BaiF CoA transferase family protein [Advenella incenata]
MVTTNENESKLPLAGVVVLDLTWLLPGPFCTHILKELGAEVIKVEKPEGGDYLRDLLPEAYMLINRGKKSIAIDLKTQHGRNEFEYLVRECDVIVESFRPGVAQRLEVDYDRLSSHNPSLIYLSISGYGQTGPLASVAGHDINYLALAGALSIPAHWGESPRRSGLPMADLAASLYGAINVVAALRTRDVNGNGEYIDLSIAESVLHWTQVRFADHAESCDGTYGWNHVWPGNDVFTTKDRRHLALGIVEEKFWKNFGAAAQWREAASMAETFECARCEQSRQIAGNLLREQVSARIAEHDIQHWLHVLAEHDVPHSSINDKTGVFREPQFLSRDAWEEIPGQNQSSIKAVNLPGTVFRGARGRAPRLDEHGSQLRARFPNDLREQTVLSEKGSST